MAKKERHRGKSMPATYLKVQNVNLAIGIQEVVCLGSLSWYV